MKQEVSTPIFALIIVVVLVGLGAFIWKSTSGSNQGDTTKIAKELKAMERKDLAPISQEQINKDFRSMGGKR